MKKIAIYALVLLFSCSAFAEEFGQVDIHGFVSQGYLLSDDHNIYYAKTRQGTFEFNEMGINFATDLTDNLRAGMQLFAKDLGDIGNDEITVDWAYADYRYRNWLGLRVGKIKKPNGMYNQTRDIDATRTSIFLPASIYNENYRESQLASKGVGLYGTLPGHVDYQIVYGVFDMSKDGPISRHLVDLLDEGFQDMSLESISSVYSVSVENSPNASIMWNTPLEGFRLGGMYSKYDFTHYVDVYLPDSEITLPTEIRNEGQQYIGSAEYTLGDLRVSGEYRIVDIKVITSLDPANPTEQDYEDYYVMLNYRFADWVELGTYYSVHYEDKDDKDGKNKAAEGKPRYEGWLKDLALSARYDINDSWVFKLEAHYMDGLAGVDYTSDSENPNDPNPNWFLYAAKMSFSF